MSFTLTDISRKIFKNIYWIILVTYIFSVFFNIERVLVCGILIFILGIIFIAKNKGIIYGCEKPYFVFMIYAFMTFGNYLFNGYSINIFGSAMIGSFFPALLFMCRDSKLYRECMKNSFAALLVAFIVSIILHTFSPQFYQNYLFERGYITVNNTFWAKYFFQGIFGVTALGTLSACASIFYLCKYLNQADVKSFVSLMVSAVTVFLTGRRSAIATFVIGFFFILGTRIIKSSRLKINKIIVDIIAVFVVVIIVIYNWDLLLKIAARVVNVFDAFSERNGDWEVAINSLTPIELLLGTGFGTMSHTALQYGYVAVSDSNLIEWICEIGGVGTIVFIFLVLYVVVRNIKCITVHYSYLSAVLTIFVFMVQAIGSNVFEFQTTAPLFWISLGYVAHLNKNEELS